MLDNGPGDDVGEHQPHGQAGRRAPVVGYGWSSGAAPALTTRVLGVGPSPRVRFTSSASGRPPVGEGDVPTPHGTIPSPGASSRGPLEGRRPRGAVWANNPAQGRGAGARAGASSEEGRPPGRAERRRPARSRSRPRRRAGEGGTERRPRRPRGSARSRPAGAGSSPGRPRRQACRGCCLRRDRRGAQSRWSWAAGMPLANCPCTGIAIATPTASPVQSSPTGVAQVRCANWSEPTPSRGAIRRPPVR
jgi:hypothetical protein